MGFRVYHEGIGGWRGGMDPPSFAMPDGTVITIVPTGPDSARIIEEGTWSEPRTLPPLLGEGIPEPARPLSTTATFPSGASAQEPIISGSRSFNLYGDSWDPAVENGLDGRVSVGDPFGWRLPPFPDKRLEGFRRQSAERRQFRRDLQARARRRGARRGLTHRLRELSG